MNVNDFCQKIVEASIHPSVYANATFGWRCTSKMKNRALKNTLNATVNRKAIEAAPENAIMYDCSGLIKYALWGGCFDMSKDYTGAEYKSNGVPDLNENGLIANCTNVRPFTGEGKPGEILWMKGHCGVYMGGGLAIECTSSFNGGVQAIKTSGRGWEKIGESKYIDYTQTISNTVTIQVSQIEEMISALSSIVKTMRGWIPDGDKVL